MSADSSVSWCCPLLLQPSLARELPSLAGLSATGLSATAIGVSNRRRGQPPRSGLYRFRQTPPGRQAQTPLTLRGHHGTPHDSGAYLSRLPLPSRYSPENGSENPPRLRWRVARIQTRVGEALALAPRLLLGRWHLVTASESASSSATWIVVGTSGKGKY